MAAAEQFYTNNLDNLNTEAWTTLTTDQMGGITTVWTRQFGEYFTDNLEATLTQNWTPITTDEMVGVSTPWTRVP